jgi:hypothetical protein
MLLKISYSSLAIILAFCCFIGTTVHSQEETVDAQTKDQLKVIMAHLLDTIYVSPEIGKQLSKQLQANFESGAYKDAATPTQLTEMLTREICPWRRRKQYNSVRAGMGHQKAINVSGRSAWPAAWPIHDWPIGARWACAE